MTCLGIIFISKGLVPRRAVRRVRGSLHYAHESDILSLNWLLGRLYTLLSCLKGCLIRAGVLTCSTDLYFSGPKKYNSVESGSHLPGVHLFWPFDLRSKFSMVCVGATLVSNLCLVYLSAGGHDWTLTKANPPIIWFVLWQTNDTTVVPVWGLLVISSFQGLTSQVLSSCLTASGPWASIPDHHTHPVHYDETSLTPKIRTSFWYCQQKNLIWYFSMATSSGNMTKYVDPSTAEDTEVT